MTHYQSRSNAAALQREKSPPSSSSTMAAAGDAAGDALKATRDQLQLSAVDLIERMAALQALAEGGGE